MNQDYELGKAYFLLNKEFEKNKNLTRELISKEEQYRLLFELSPDAIFLLSGKGDILKANKKAISQYGYSEEELLNLHYTKLLEPEKIQQFPENFKKMHEEKSLFLSRHTKKDKSSLIVEVHTSPIKINHENFVIMVIRDLTEIKKAEEIKKENEDLIKAQFDYGTIGVAILSADKKWIKVNQKLCEILGYTEEELLQKMPAEITCPEDRELDLKMYQLLLSGERDTGVREKRFFRKDGKIVFVYIGISCLRNLDRSVRFFIVSFSDITEKKKYEQEKSFKDALILRMQKLSALGTLSSSIVHEICQPLQLIKIISETVKKRIKKKASLNPKDQKDIEDLSELSGGVDKINQIIENMNRLIKSTEHVQLAYINPCEVLASLKKTYSLKLKKHDIRFIVEFPDFLPDIYSEKILLEQVLNNIINNAADALKNENKTDKLIFLSSYQSGLNLLIEISDNGTGIPAHMIGSIFDPLFTSKEEGNSIGMGLYIVKNIVEVLGGAIEAGNNKMGGASFKISLPLRS